MSDPGATIARHLAPDRSRDGADDHGDVYDAPRPIDTAVASLAITLLSVITAIGFCRVFDGWEFLRPMLFVVIGAHLACFALRVLRVPGYLAVPASMLIVFWLIAWRYYPSTMSGPFPSGRTWDFLTSDLRLAREQFPSAVAPVAAVGGFVVAASAAVGLAAVAADSFAFRAFGRAEATVPSAVLFVFAAALGVDTHRVLLAALWLAGALAVIAVLRLTHAQSEFVWVGRRARVMLNVAPLIVVLVGCAAVGGAIVGPRLPGANAEGLIDTNEDDGVTEVVSPLVDIRSRLINLSRVEQFTVVSPEPRYWRVTGLEQFDGTRWGLPERELRAVSGDFATGSALSRTLPQQLRISALVGELVPAAYAATSVDADGVYWVADSGTLVVPDRFERGDVFTIESSVLDLDPNILRGATASSPPSGDTTALPDDFPDSVAQVAREITDNGATVYDKALLLQNWFHDNFEYDLTVQRGHSNNALENFLRIRRGYCEQFSGAFAAMARSLGIPARVAVGFTSGELREDGRYHVYGRNAHAWPEIWFDGIGWVSFEPTPGRGEPGAEEYTGVEPQQAGPNENGGSGDNVTPLTSPVTATTQLPSDPDATSSSVVSGSTTTTTIPVNLGGGSDGDKGSPIPMILAVLAIAAVVWMLMMPAVLGLLRGHLRPRTPTGSITHSWRRAARALDLLALAPHVGETPTEHAARVARRSDLDGRALRELAEHATAATYGDVGDEATATRCATLADEMVAAVRARLGPQDRLLNRLDPRRARLLTP